MKALKLSIPVLLISLLHFTAGAQDFKMGYVNLNEIYLSLPGLQQADSIHRMQLARLDNYVAAAQEKIKSLDLDDRAVTLYVNAYNDTIAIFKKQVDEVYNKAVISANNRIQAAIDSVGKQHDFDYILSTVNNNIMYVKDEQNNITGEVIAILRNGNE